MIAACVRLRFPPFVLCWSHLIFKYFFLPGDLRHLRDLLNVVAVLLFIFVLIFYGIFHSFWNVLRGKLLHLQSCQLRGSYQEKEGEFVRGSWRTKLPSTPKLSGVPVLPKLLGDISRRGGEQSI